jgi:tetratricopeptide (TPR) repeat protein
VPDSVRADQLDPEALSELRTLPGDLADAVARYLVATGLEEDPERGYEYAKAARNLAARVGIVRETCAIAAYQAGHWSDALAEFRAARRLTGRDSYLPLMADCERALGRLDRALDIVTGPEAKSADRATQIELRIVESGIRRDQGLPDAGVVALQVPELTDKRGRAGRARLFYAYADALLDAGREEEARDWFGKAAAADAAGETDAAERLDELDEVLIEDLDEDDVDDAELEAELADEATDDEDFEDEDPDDEDPDDEDLADQAVGDSDPADEGLPGETAGDEDSEDEDSDDAGLAGEVVADETLRAETAGDEDLAEADVDTGVLDDATRAAEADPGRDASELHAAGTGPAADADAGGAGDATSEASVVSEPIRAE